MQVNHVQNTKFGKVQISPKVPAHLAIEYSQAKGFQKSLLKDEVNGKLINSNMLDLIKNLVKPNRIDLGSDLSGKWHFNVMTNQNSAEEEKVFQTLNDTFKAKNLDFDVEKVAD